MKGWFGALACLTWTAFARADAPSPYAPPPDAFWMEPPSQRPPPYTQPFQLRSMVPKNSVRFDTTVAPYRTANAAAFAGVAFVSGQLKVADELALQARWGFDMNHTDAGGTRYGIVSPTAGVLFGVPLGSGFRFAASLNVGIPVATGGGNDANPADVALQKTALLVRSAMDNSNFGTNSVGFPTGVSFAYLASGFTGQLDATLIPSVRVKGDEVEADASRVNSTYGLFFGYFIVPEFSLGLEVRYQRYLSTPAAVAKDPSARENLTIGGGPRLHLSVADGVWIRPGLCYARGARGPVEQGSFEVVQLDVPISF